MVATLLGIPYRSAQTSYDLWRLRGKGLIERLPGTHSYVLTPDGIRAALFYTKTYWTLVDPLFAAAAPDAGPRASPELRSALRVIDQTFSHQATDLSLAA